MASRNKARNNSESVVINWNALHGCEMGGVLDYYNITPNDNGFALCPFHDDHNESMKVYPDGFYCFSCGAGGDQVEFVRRMEEVDRIDAAKRLMSILGLKSLTQHDAEQFTSNRRRVVDEQRERVETLDFILLRLCKMRERYLRAIRSASNIDLAWYDAGRYERHCEIQGYDEAARNIAYVEEMLDRTLAQLHGDTSI